MSSTSIVHPLHYLTIERKGTEWHFHTGGRVVYNPSNVPVSLDCHDRMRQFGLNFAKVAIELFRINAGKAGYYLANLRERKYYYCGTSWKDVKTTLISLGIGRADPME
jgi:hypothetical protein